MSEEVLSVCNLSTGVYNKGVSAGELKKAREIAYELHDMGLPNEKIARAVKVGMETLRIWLANREELPVK